MLAGLLVALLVLWWSGAGVPGADWLREYGLGGGRGQVVLSAQTAQRLQAIPVRPKSAASAYRREAFGQAWADTDRNGCDTRNDVLARDLTEVRLRAGGCKVASGTLADPYTGRSIAFTAGAQSRAVQIDHVVALSDAWNSGASQWDAARRQQLANDPQNLLAVDGPANEDKGAADAGSWLPANRAYRCPYVSRQIMVKAAYGLSVTEAEKAGMLRVLAACPDYALP